jgi:hypothetical protein
MKPLTAVETKSFTTFGSPAFWRDRMKKNVIAVAVASLFVGPFAFATSIPIQVDLGPTGKVYGSRAADLPAPSVQFEGQTIAIDFSFLNGQFIRLFTATKNTFRIDAFFRINNGPLSLNFAGSGFLTDSQGAELGSAVALDASLVTDLVHVTGVDLLLSALISNSVPADVYGIHLDLTLPNSPGFEFGDGPVGGITFGGNVFGIGPGSIPRDIVPDVGNTALFLTITLGGLIAMRASVTSAG